MVSGLTRVVVLFLILRVVGSPLALRPTTQQPHPDYHFVVRICSWPAPRPERSPATSVLLTDSRDPQTAGSSILADSPALRLPRLVRSSSTARFRLSTAFRESLRC